MAPVTVDDALNHPTWKMGANPRSRWISAHALMNSSDSRSIERPAGVFGLPGQVHVVVHPQSIIHYHGRVRGRLGHRPARRGRHGHPRSSTRSTTPTACRGRGATRPDACRLAHVRGAGRRPLPVPGPRRARPSPAAGCAPAVLNAANELAVGAFPRPGASATRRSPELIALALERAPAQARSTASDLTWTSTPRRAPLRPRAGRLSGERRPPALAVSRKWRAGSRPLWPFVVGASASSSSSTNGGHFIVRSPVRRAAWSASPSASAPCCGGSRGEETEYCLSAIPMGGYVKMMGDDENPLEGGRTARGPQARLQPQASWVRFLISASRAPDELRPRRAC